MKLMPPDT